MIALLLGITGFILCFLYDINSFTLRSRVLHSTFGIGTALIAVATVLDLRTAWKADAFSGFPDLLLLLLGAACFAALIYCLFFALPFHETYAEQTGGRCVYDRGVYALCRHPGILCFFGMFLFAGMAAFPCPLLMHGMVFSLLNLAYALFQDRITFPKTFCDYHTYRKRVPFLIPTRDSTRLARDTWPRADGKEDES